MKVNKKKAHEPFDLIRVMFIVLFHKKKKDTANIHINKNQFENE